MRRYKTLSELITLYLQPNQGLVCTLLYPVERDKDKENAEDRDYSGATGLSSHGTGYWGSQPGLGVSWASWALVAADELLSLILASLFQMARMKSPRCHHALAPPASSWPAPGLARPAWDPLLCRMGQLRGKGLQASQPLHQAMPLLCPHTPAAFAHACTLAHFLLPRLCPMPISPGTHHTLPCTLALLPSQCQWPQHHLARVPEGELHAGPGGSQGGGQQLAPSQQDPGHLLQAPA